MKNLILILLLIPMIGNGQKLIEASISNEDKAIGISYIDAKNHFLIGAESGTYKYSKAKIEHQKYKLGYSKLFTEILNGENNLLLTASGCFNKYNVIYNYDQVKNMPELSCEIGVRTNFNERVYIGFNYDFIHLAGGFSVSFLISE